jgi:hypothetical protein
MPHKPRRFPVPLYLPNVSRPASRKTHAKAKKIAAHLLEVGGG